MQIDQRVQIGQLHFGQQRRANDAGVVHDGRDLEALDQLLRRLSGGGAVAQIHLDAVHVRVLQLAFAPRQRHHIPAAFEQVFANDAADTGAATGDYRGFLLMLVAHRSLLYSATSARTRSGLPLPC